MTCWCGVPNEADGWTHLRAEQKSHGALVKDNNGHITHFKTVKARKDAEAKQEDT